MSNYDKDLTHIRSLLDRYFRCETSPEEEKELGDFFARSLSDLPADLEAGRRFFRALGSVPKTIEVPVGLVASLKKSLNEKAAMQLQKIHTVSGSCTGRVYIVWWKWQLLLPSFSVLVPL